MQTETVAVAANPWASARGAARHLREVAIMAGAYFAYMYTRTLVFDSEETALANARRVVNLEESFGFFWEPNWQAYVIDSAQALVIFFNWAYIFTFWPIILVTAVTMYIVNRRIYFYYRNIVLLTFFIALFTFMLFPLAPPRMLSEYFVDTIREFGPGFYASREAANYYNAFAAMPSLHFTWTVIFGLMFFRSGRLPLQILGIAYPTMTLFAITVTANHYIVDAIAGALVAAIALTLMWGLHRLRRRGSLAPTAAA